MFHTPVPIVSGPLASGVMAYLLNYHHNVETHHKGSPLNNYCPIERAIDCCAIHCYKDPEDSRRGFDARRCFFADDPIVADFIDNWKYLFNEHYPAFPDIYEILKINAGDYNELIVNVDASTAAEIRSLRNELKTLVGRNLF